MKSDDPKQKGELARQDRRLSDTRRQSDLQALLAVLCQTKTRDGFVSWCKCDLNRHLPHGAFVCCLGKVNGKTATPIEIISDEFPEEYLQADLGSPGNFRANIMRHWLNSGVPILANPDEVGRVIDDPAGLKNFNDSRLQNIAAHGMHDFTRVYVSHFCFHRVSECLNERHERLLELLVPPMHAALIRVLHHANGGKTAEQQCNLTPRELEILGWISSGKTNDEIASILGTRYKTVKNQVQSILVKLQVSNRAQAVAKAAKLGLSFNSRV
jgi:transcriptional regulator EpsA